MVAPVPTTLPIAFCSKDPIGYEDGTSLFAAYFVLMGGWDPYGLRGSGHHIVPWSIFNGLVTDDVQNIFDGDNARLFDDCYNTHNFGPANGVKHSDYNKAVKDALDDFLGGKPISQMTPDEAQRFLNQIKSAPPSSTIGKFNAGIKKQIAEAVEKAAREAAEKATKSGALKCCKKLGGACMKKAGPVCAFFFFCNDAAHGGINHACSEALWPLSELIPDEPIPMPPPSPYPDPFPLPVTPW